MLARDETHQTDPLADPTAPRPAQGVETEPVTPTLTTLAAPITPPGRGALATVRVFGPEAVRVVAILCHAEPKSFLRKTREGRLWFGRWRDAKGEPVVVRVEAPDRVEIHCHGGPMPSRIVLEDLAHHGVATVRWHELVRKESSSLIEVEAIEALVQTPTVRTASILLDQLHGALSRRLAALRVWLDQGKLSDVAGELAGLLSHAELGRHLIKPWRIAIVGRPNVGKSSLLNAIVGYERALVHPVAGTTRDVVTGTTAIDGWPVEFSDSAGIRVAEDALESAGIDRARRTIADSDGQIAVFDLSHPLAAEDFAILDLCPRPILAANKSDLAGVWTPAELSIHAFATSARSRSGIDCLLSHIGDGISAGAPAVGEPIPFTARQVELLDEAEQCLRRGAVPAARDALARIVADDGKM